MKFFLLECFMDYKFPFFNPELPLQERINDLISRLTLDEKAGFIPTRNQPVERLDIPLWHFGAEGAHGFVDREGNNTTFPQTIGLAAGWDRELLRKIGEAAGTEARVFYKKHNDSGGLAIWSPTIDLERDPRWGRTEEGYGEDPFLTGELSSAYIHGAQGDDPFYLRVSCGPKHFFANNNEKNRMNCSCSIPPRVMHEYYLAPFEKAVKKAKAVSLMTAYNEVNGIPMMLHPILNDIVKKEWGIEGNLVTDGGDFLQTVNAHNYFETHAETLASALKNGADSMTDNYEEVISAVKEAVEKKLIDEKELDEHLRRILAVRFRLGQFDESGRCPYSAVSEKDLMKEEYRALSLEAVKKSAVLLKNKDGLLPLRPESIKGKIAVIGPLADIVHLDWYSGIPTYTVTPLEGLCKLYGEDKIIHADFRKLVSFSTEDGRPLVLSETGNPRGKLLCAGKTGEIPARFYLEDWGWGSHTLIDEESGLLLETCYWRKAPGGSSEDEQCTVAASGKTTLSWFNYSVFNLLPQENGLFILRTFDNRRIAAPKTGPVLQNDDPAPGAGELFRMKIEQDGFAGVVEAAAKADQVIFIGGSNPMINGRECTDRPSLDLPPTQEELLQKIVDINPKITLALISGYPFTFRELAKKIPAILWMAPGIQETGNGLAGIISGGYSPAGRLPLTWYEDEKQLPSIMEYDIISAGTTYQYFSGKVMWPFGHGLSYSSFTYSNLSIDKKSACENETVAVTFKLKNTGSVKADEVPQMYVSVSGSSFRRPLKSLKGFERISLAAGEEKTIRFELEINELAIWDSYQGRFCIEESACTVMVGSSSSDIRLSGSFGIHGENLLPRKIPGTIYAERFDDYSNCYLHEKRGSGIPAVFSKQDGSWVHFSSLDFSTGFSRCSVIARGTPGSRIEIRLDAPDGALTGTINLPNTGDICTYELNPLSPRRNHPWAYAETELDKVTGIHDLYLAFYGNTGVWRINFN
jgi:beta-glucosidase